MAFAPSDISGLTLAWSPDLNVSTDANGITAVGGAYGTSVGLTAASPNQPQLSSGTGPLGQNLFSFTAASTQYFSFAPQTFSALTVIGVVAVQGTAAARMWFGKSAVATTFMQFGANQLNIQTRPTSGGGTVTTNFIYTDDGAISTGEGLTNSLRVFAFTYDSTAGTNGVGTAYVDNLAGPQKDTANYANKSFTLDRLGVLLTSTNPFNGLMGPQLVYNRVLTSSELTQVYNFLSSWRPTALYCSPSIGSDSTLTPWNSATPFRTIAAGYDSLRYSQTLYMDRNSVSRINANTDKPLQHVPGNSSTDLIVVDYSSWGSNSSQNSGGNYSGLKHQVRPSTAPTLTNISGFVYSAGTVTPNTNYPPAFIYAVPGGKILYGPSYSATYLHNGVPAVNCCISVINKYSNNVLRLTSGSYPPTPGTWYHDTAGTYGTANTLYVNAGQSLSTGDIEVPSFVANAILHDHDNWKLVGPSVAFAFGAGLNNRAAADALSGGNITGPTGITIESPETVCNAADGIDYFDSSVVEVPDTFTAFNGSGLTAVGGAGDGMSGHDTSTFTAERLIAIHNDKSTTSGHSGVTAVVDRALLVGTRTAGVNNESPIYTGSYTYTNSVMVVPPGMPDPSGAENTALGAVPLNVQGCTIVSMAAESGSAGIKQTSALSSITARNNIIVGFATGISGAVGSGIVADHNCFFENLVNHLNVARGVGDVFASPLFEDSPNDVSFTKRSPCSGAGVDVGLTYDYFGNPRPSKQTIGAIEAKDVVVHGSNRRLLRKKRDARDMRAILRLIKELHVRP